MSKPIQIKRSDLPAFIYDDLAAMCREGELYRILLNGEDARVEGLAMAHPGMLMRKIDQLKAQLAHELDERFRRRFEPAPADAMPLVALGAPQAGGDTGQ